MKIIIDDNLVDSQLENEQTILDVIDEITNWLNQNHRIVVKIYLNNEDTEKLDEKRLLEKPKGELKIITISANELIVMELKTITTTLESIIIFLQDGKNNLESEFQMITLFDNIETYLAPKELPLIKKQFYQFNNRKEESARNELIYSLRAFKLRSIERELEYSAPIEELKRTQTVLQKIFDEIESIPLNLQTEKSVEALDKITLFTEAIEKFNRIIPIIHQDHTDLKITKDQTLKDFFNELSLILEELADGFNKDDKILIGDLMEYEIAPKIKKLIKFIDKIR